MTHLPFTLAAYFFNALSVLTSKFLLTKTIPDPLVYIFYISLFSLLVILGLPFTKTPTIETFNLASFSTLLWTLGAYFMFKALKIGSVSRVIPVIGTFIPLILLVFAAQTQTISQMQTWAVWLLIAGMIFLTLPDWQGNFSKKEIIFEILSAALFAFSYIILRQAYLNADFFSVLVWSRLILIPLGILLFLIPSFRRKIIASKGPTNLLFLGGQISGAASETLILFSISLANPALVNSLQGTQYIFLLIFGLFFFKEKYTFLILLSKLTGIILIGAGLYLLTSPL
ncbi:hypothetical protein HYU94_00735 [Candidatus Daviesbacteria bacterium]|nr:hypothetical protein [Candidatus Daviesbacteria bacterium]